MIVPHKCTIVDKHIEKVTLSECPLTRNPMRHTYAGVL
jgi:hypothetical protein